MNIQRELVTDPTAWQNTLAALDNQQLLQTWTWGDFKSRHGWCPWRLRWHQNGRVVAACQVLQRQERRFGVSTSLLYTARGPVLDWQNQALWAAVTADLQRFSHEKRVLMLKMDAGLTIATGVPGDPEQPYQPLLAATENCAHLQQHGWRYSTHQIQFPNTVLLDLQKTQDLLLQQFKQKTRYNIRLAAKKGVTVRTGDANDFETCYQLYAETAQRDRFLIRQPAYYQDAWQALWQAGLCQPFLAEVAGQTVAAIIVTLTGKTATYMYGMSTDGPHRALMPNYLLQWEAICWAQQRGCLGYDFWGAPTHFSETDPLWGVWRFKAGFCGEVVHTLGAWDYPTQKLSYWVYQTVLPNLKNVWEYTKHLMAKNTYILGVNSGIIAN
jgi:peptidoglycan pentaglycine glycine transferase (the first glycine)